MTERLMWITFTTILGVALIVASVLFYQQTERTERIVVMTAIQNANLLASAKKGDLDEVQKTLELALRADLGTMHSYVEMRGDAESDHYQVLLAKLSENHPELYAHLTKEGEKPLDID